MRLLPAAQRRARFSNWWRPLGLLALAASLPSPAQAQWQIDPDIYTQVRRTAPVITGAADPDDARIGDTFEVECEAYNPFGLPIDGAAMTLEVDDGLRLEWVGGGYTVTGRDIGVQTLRCIPEADEHDPTIEVGVVNVRPEILRHARAYTTLDGVPAHLLEIGDTFQLHPLAFTDVGGQEAGRPGGVQAIVYRGDRDCGDIGWGSRGEADFQLGPVDADHVSTWTPRRLGRYTFIQRIASQGPTLCVATPIEVLEDAHPPTIDVRGPNTRTRVDSAYEWLRVSGYVTDTGSGVDEVEIIAGPHRTTARLYPMRDGRTYFVEEMPIDPGLMAIQIRAVDRAGRAGVATRALHVGESFRSAGQLNGGAVPVSARISHRLISDPRPGVDSVEEVFQAILAEVDIFDGVEQEIEFTHPDVNVTGAARLGDMDLRMWLQGDRLMVQARFPNFRTDLKLTCRSGVRCWLGALFGYRGEFDGAFKASARGSITVRAPMALGVGPEGGPALHFFTEELEFTSGLTVTNTADAGGREISKSIHEKIMRHFEEQFIDELDGLFTEDGADALGGHTDLGWYGLLIGNWWTLDVGLPALVGEGDDVDMTIYAYLDDYAIDNSHLRLDFLTGMSVADAIHGGVSMLEDGRDLPPPFLYHFGSPPSRDMDAAVHVDAMNAALFTAWRGGAFDIEMPLAEALALAGEPAPVVEGLEIPWASVFPTAALRISTELPPRIADYQSLQRRRAYVQLGAVRVEYDLRQDYGSAALVEASIISRLSLGFQGGALVIGLDAGARCGVEDSFTDCGFQRTLALAEPREGMHLEADGAQVEAFQLLGFDARPLLFERLGALSLDALGRGVPEEDEALAEALWGPLESVILELMSQRIELPVIELAPLLSGALDMPGLGAVQVENASFADRLGLIHDGWLMFEGDVTAVR